MNYRKPLIGLSIFLVLAVIVSWMVFVTLIRAVNGPANTYSAVFTDVSGLHAGDDVRVAGVRVGRVDKVQLRGTLAQVTFRVQKEQQLFTNTDAAVNYQNIIGQRYLALLTPPGQRILLAPGGEIPVERTTPSFDISRVLNGFEPLFAVLDPHQADNLSNAIVEAFQGDSGSVLSVITQTSAFAQSLVGPDDMLGGVITNLNDLVGILAKQTDNLEQVIQQTRTALVTLNGRRDALIASTGLITGTVQRLSAIVNNIFPDLQALIRRDPGWVTIMNGHPEPWAYMLQNMPLMLKSLARISQRGAYADGYFCNLNTTILASQSRILRGIVRLASPGNVVQNSAVCR
ncbi:phospholipid/cholesterol/gamma-HCH transport system substrate-binding protein [Mycobacterium sp. MAA66]|uniref:MCE family protein n=1 Tax=Mycobacterium sp. MAA66 TaxID=3156297 RepID=UPI00351964C0